MEKVGFRGLGFVIRFCVVMGVCMAVLGAVPCWALREPSVNLGATSFLDGGPPAGPGFYLTEYVQYYTAPALKGDNGDDLLPGLDEHLDVWASLTQFIYQSNQDIVLGGKWGLNVIVPVVSINLDAFPLSENGGGLGDINVGPFLQWDPIMGKQGPIFMHRIEFTMLFPTGDYDNQKDLNPGSNFFSFNPYWAGTFFLTPKWTASWRLHYLWNAENTDPTHLDALVPGVEDTRAGQAMHLNFASEYEVWDKRLRFGLNGYYFKQITDDQVNGNDISGSREQVFGIGPGFIFHYDQNNHFFFNVYMETAAEMRPQGTRINLRYVHHF